MSKSLTEEGVRAVWELLSKGKSHGEAARIDRSSRPVHGVEACVEVAEVDPARDPGPAWQDENAFRDPGVGPNLRI